MFTAWTERILDLIREHGAASVFLGVIVESVIVPIPSPLIIMGAGAMLVPPGSGPAEAVSALLRLVVLPGAVGATVGAYFGYGLGYAGGRSAVTAAGPFLGFSWTEVESMRRRLQGGRGALLVVALRLLPVVPLSLVSVALGAMRWPAASFGALTFAGSVPRCLVLGLLGCLTRDAYSGLAGRLQSAESFVSAGIVAAAAGIILWLRLRVGGSLKREEGL